MNLSCIKSSDEEKGMSPAQTGCYFRSIKIGFLIKLLSCVINIDFSGVFFVICGDVLIDHRIVSRHLTKMIKFMGKGCLHMHRFTSCFSLNHPIRFPYMDLVNCDSRSKEQFFFNKSLIKLLVLTHRSVCVFLGLPF